MNLQDALHKVICGEDLTEQEMISVMRSIMEGEVEEVPLASFLTALRMKGESIPEITGAARVMREKAEKMEVPSGSMVDTCGTGGDGGHTFNISTAAAFVVAGTGIRVAKHGNRAVSSRSGSADVLKALGVNIEAKKETVEKCLHQVGMGFLFAPLLHGAMKHAAPVRKILGFRTIFNLLGPLTNPAGAGAQVLGVFADRWVSPIAHVLHELGCHHAFVVNGEDGLDEITLMGKTRVAELINCKIKEYFVCPEDFGLRRCSPPDVDGGTPAQNAEIIRNILKGNPGPQRDIVCLNAAAAICAGGKADSIKDGLRMAYHSIQSGAARGKLEALCEISFS